MMNRSRRITVIQIALIIAWAIFCLGGIFVCTRQTAACNLPTDSVQPMATVTGKAALNFEALPDDVIARVAVKAILGFFGELSDWQEKAYEHALAQGATVNGRAWVTHYGPPRFYRGKSVRWGMGCSERVAAAIMIDRAWYGGLPLGKRDRPGLDRSRQVWTGDYILVELPTGWQMRQILDTGAMWNLPKARSKGCDIWLDLWTDVWSERNETWHC